MVNDYTVDPQVWFSNRELDHAPKHFVVTKTRLTVPAKTWIIDKLKGRYAIVASSVKSTDEDFDFWFPDAIEDDSGAGGFPAFEDPNEAIFYELTWS